MSIVEKEGVYLLCSCDAFGKRIYKVGRSDNLRQRLGSYPPNWCLLDCLPCENSPSMERKIIKGFKTNFKIYDRHEYFEIDADFHEIKFFFNKTIYEEKPGMSRTCEPPLIVDEKPKKKMEIVLPTPPKAEPPKDEANKRRIVFKQKASPLGNLPPTLTELRDDQLETHGGVMTKDDLIELMKDFNKLIDIIVGCKTESIETQRKKIKDQLDSLISKKRSKEVAETIVKEGLTTVTLDHKISMKEVEAQFKK